MKLEWVLVLLAGIVIGATIAFAASRPALFLSGILVGGGIGYIVGKIHGDAQGRRLGLGERRSREQELEEVQDEFEQIFKDARKGRG